jgi:hypothetical protein
VEIGDGENVRLDQRVVKKDSSPLSVTRVVVAHARFTELPFSQRGSVGKMKSYLVTASVDDSRREVSFPHRRWTNGPRWSGSGTTVIGEEE